MADFSAIRKEECRESKLPNGGELNGSHTVVLQSVINEIKEHGRSSMHAEVCGVLVGSLCWDGEPYLLIDGRIEGKHASHQSGSVTFTSETWDFVHEELAAKYPDRKIVGWYHTHPGFGIFLSNMDAFIHENFFSLPWEPAYVFDPQAETDGFFFKVGTELVKEDVSISPDVPPSVKDPSLASAGIDRIVINDMGSRRYALFVVLAAALVCCLAGVVVVSIEKVRKTEEKARCAESKATSLSNVLADKESVLVEKEKEIIRHKRAADEWIVQKETYEREIDGLRVKVTTVTTERKNLEASNKARQAEVELLKSKRAELERAARERETKMSELTSEVNCTKAELASVREQKRQLELRIQELGNSEQRMERTCESSHSAIPLSKERARPETNDKENRHWFSWLIFWK